MKVLLVNLVKLQLELIELFFLVSALVKEFKFEGGLQTDIWDVFNDKPNWKCSTWADLKRLNLEQNAIVDKFELLDKSNAKAKNELAKYLHNFEVIQTGLGQLESKTLSEQSRLPEFQKRVTEINTLLAELKKDGVKFKPSTFVGGSILNREQVNQLTNWYGTGWKLLYKASRDGWQGSDFHSKCDNKGETVTVIKVNNYVFGGYLGASWILHNNYIQCQKASLFTLVNPYGIVPTSFNIVNISYAANGSNFGPTFGTGHDLHIASSANNNTSSYSSFPYSYRDTSGKDV